MFKEMHISQVCEIMGKGYTCTSLSEKNCEFYILLVCKEEDVDHYDY